MFEFVRRTWRRWTGPPGRIKDVVVVSGIDAVPQAIRPAVIYLVGDDAHRKWLIAGCPCGCGESLWLNLMRNGRPRWSVDGEGDHITVAPSLAVTTCGSHFWIRRGMIVWV